MSDIRRDIKVRQVRDRGELEEALTLVHDNYVRCGYTAPQPGGIRLNAHCALPTTRTYVALVQGEVCATVSLFEDSPIGLPTDAVFADRLKVLRAPGGKIAEVGMLADRRSALRRGMPVVLRMMKHVFWVGLNQHIDDLVITVNPRHVSFYQRILCFDPVSPVRKYPAVGSAPGVLLRVNLPGLEPQRSQNAEIRKMFLTPPSQDEPVAAPYRMTREDIEYFFVTRTNVLTELNAEQICAIEQCYPGLVVSRLLKPPRAVPVH